eukprot:TRINITY_DN5541_c0_g1_i1.p1 TRINITY_DN5541_c0_g1~~TRINITY_DN5541_c0_g1_i1.p1  ORF type:complete len:193 (+),score=33.01 TRINITY_DN5541_c0_g1_i1:48-581(+)
MCIRDRYQRRVHGYPLPHSYDQVISELYTKNCPKCNTNTRAKGLCLVCGAIVCIFSGCCRDVHLFGSRSKIIGEASQHTHGCCVTAGVYLWMYEGLFILQSEGLGAQADSCYTNLFGENVTKFCDPSMLPLNSTEFERYTLDEERYNYFKELMLESNVMSEIWKQVSNGRKLLNEML